MSLVNKLRSAALGLALTFSPVLVSGCGNGDPKSEDSKEKITMSLASTY